MRRRWNLIALSFAKAKADGTLFHHLGVCLVVAEIALLLLFLPLAFSKLPEVLKGNDSLVCAFLFSGAAVAAIMLRYTLKELKKLDCF